jgi:ATP citrate (pro-S)-lyase
LDQKRLKQGLYRHPWDDISYMIPEQMSDTSGRTLAEGNIVVQKGFA